MNKSTTTHRLSSNYIQMAYHAFLIIAISILLYKAIFHNEKIAYVDSGLILSEYKGSIEAKKAYQIKAAVWQANIDTLSNEIKASIQKYEKSVAVMSKTEQDLSRQLIDSKQKQLANYQRGTQENARQEEGKLTQSVVAQINAFLLSYGKKHNYKLILIANQSGTIAYARDGMNITSEVIKELNNEYGGK